MCSCSFSWSGSRAAPVWYLPFKNKKNFLLMSVSRLLEAWKMQECEGWRKDMTTFDKQFTAKSLQLHSKIILFKTLRSMKDWLYRLAFRKVNSLDTEAGMCFLCSFQMLSWPFQVRSAQQLTVYTQVMLKLLGVRHAQASAVCIALQLCRLTGRLQASFLDQI